MIILFILGLFLGIVSVIFTLQNVDVVTVAFLNWHLTSSLSVIIGLALLSGFLIALLLFLPESISNYFNFRKLRKQNVALSEDLKRQKELTAFAKKSSPSEKDIKDIENGGIENPNA